MAAFGIVACGGTVDLREDLLTVGGASDISSAGMLTLGDVNDPAPVGNSSGGTASTLGGIMTAGPATPAGGSMAVGGSSTLGGTPAGGSSPLAGTGSLSQGGLGAGGSITPVAGTYSGGGASMVGGSASAAGSMPIGGTSAAGSMPVGGTSAGGSLPVGGTSPVSPVGPTFGCGEQVCETGKSYCHDYNACLPLPEPCANEATSCACYESIYGPPQMFSGGWYCTDVGPGAFIVGTWA
ncbi:MAG: hypothetical protein ABUL60_10960 [Myxococcales bacterium]